jgi:hypothetical protein
MPLPMRPKVVAAPPITPAAPPVAKEAAPAAETPAETRPDSSAADPPGKSPAAEAPVPAAEASPPDKAPPAEERQTLFSDSFADVKGSIKRNVEGKARVEVPGNTRVAHMFRGMPVEGALVLQILEDMKTEGPDGKPGVLALSWQEVPGKLQYSGFTYLGGTEDRILLTALLPAKTADDLANFRLSLRYRGVNDTATEPVKLSITWRLEPMLPDSYNKRLDLGTFTATDEWGKLDICLKDGTNAEAFLRTLAEERPTSFKIVWGQGSPIANYHAGDTLLIDEIAVTTAAK